MGRYLDGTVGGAGHAAAILAASAPSGRLFGCDQDGEAVRAARSRLAEYSGRFEVRQLNFAELGDWLDSGSIDGAVLDLGVSSHQLDVAERGFSLRLDGPLDMRMDERMSRTAADLVNELEADELAKLFFEFGGESRARGLARALVAERRMSRFQSTLQLAALAERVLPRRGRIHPATRIFQALRIAVNDELGRLDEGLRVIWSLLKPGGRLAVITFHSAEAKHVKEFGHRLALNYSIRGDSDIPEFRETKRAEMKWVERRALQPQRDEVLRNPRSRSAQLRVMEKL
ncbi:MAG: Ribosomal RNA small subunit methyltransferase H [Verrucomicrobia subdivision 3 bacterium]|nr:Ribosomal RNA small subunit methyltransferase H [Limisphaerales bacterium]MCS1412378.1 Ribosomal RNA small subunit methyltransferase H [Limisphaerales bacterium]